MARARIEIDRSGIGNVLKSTEVRAAVGQAAELIAARARSATDNPVSVRHAGQSRARSYVSLDGPDGAREEADDRPLGRALGGA